MNRRAASNSPFPHRGKVGIGASATPLVALVAVVLALIAPTSHAVNYRWGDYDDKPLDWFASDEGRRIAHHILTYQSPDGGFPKNTDMASKPYEGDPADIQPMFDNGATYQHLPFLAHTFWATEDETYANAVINGIDYILAAQYQNGGFPQRYPLRGGYPDRITFNDGAMIGVMRFLQTVFEDPDYAFVGAERVVKAREAWGRGIALILKAQVVVGDKKTVWCAQHDAETLEPRGARSYEHPSLSGAESAGILFYLMELENPSREMVNAVVEGALWFESAALPGIRLERAEDGDRVIVDDPDAPPLWARFYQIDTNQPIFSGRDGVIKYALAEIERERRTGYSWYGNWGAGVAERFAVWMTRQDVLRQVFQ
ncbi:MAG: pectate lyase [Candidatus Poribacteria bacterium]|nr:pectate lyase [Candidatus Poribacteria bacterium]